MKRADRFLRTAFARAAAGSALVLSALVCLPAQAGLFDDEEARKAILELRQRIETNRLAAEQALQRQTTVLQAETAELAKELTKRVDSEGKRGQDDTQVIKRSILDLSNQLEQLRADSAKQRGQFEQLARELSELQRRLRDRDTAVDDRLRKLEPQKVTVDGREFFAEPGEKRDYDNALAVFRRGEFAAAQAAFSDFMRRNAGSGYAGSGLFWLANAQFATKDYKESVVNFREMLKRMPDHPRAAEALLGVATSQIELKDSKSARATLNELIAAYPQSEAAATARERLTKLR